MSVREYVGARYVPLFATPIQWDNANTYEPLTIVQYEGNSYTSRQFVPAGIDIANEEYWAMTGNYNAQIEQYRQEVQQIAGQISDIQDQAIPFETVAEMKTATLSAGFIVRTANYAKRGDNGGNTYIIANAGTDDGGSCIAVGSLYALAVGELENVEKWGADNSGAVDSSAAINACLNYNKGKMVRFNGGTFLCNYSVNTPFENDDKTNIYGNNSTLNFTSGNLVLGGSGTGAENASGFPVFVYDLVIQGMGDLGIEVATGHKDVVLKNCEVHGFANGIKVYSATGRPSDILIDSCLFYGQGFNVDGTGCEFNGTDNLIVNSRIYGYAPSMVVNGMTDIKNVHTLIKTNGIEPSDPEFETYFKNTKFCVANASVRIENSYCDSEYCFVDCGTPGYVRVLNSQYLNIFENSPFRVFSLVSNCVYTIQNNGISLPTGTNDDRYGIYFKTSNTSTFFNGNFTCKDNAVLNASSLKHEYDIIKNAARYNYNSTPLTQNEWYAIYSRVGFDSNWNHEVIMLSNGVLQFDWRHSSNTVSFKNMELKSDDTFKVNIGIFFEDSDYNLQTATICFMYEQAAQTPCGYAELDDSDVPHVPFGESNVKGYVPQLGNTPQYTFTLNG